MISDDEAERAADFLRDNAKEAGRLKGARVKAEEFRKSLKAILMQDVNEQALGAQERHAYSHDRYLSHLDVLADAVAKDEINRALREAAVMRIEVWRTQMANIRGKL